MSRVINTGKGFLGFHRLAIMGVEESGMQPFEKDGNLSLIHISEPTRPY